MMGANGSFFGHLYAHIENALADALDVERNARIVGRFPRQRFEERLRLGCAELQLPYASQ
jgi:hypothetical protein